MIALYFNGLEYKTEAKTLGDFLIEVKAPVGKIAVEVNLRVIPRSEYDEFMLQNGMKIEAITFVGGG